ncbi:uncharacterized protein LOC121382611 [Gigantopelta aegis]|uniref:uncharacterized protein LOC121382611 n=1 Tax=Gigantopelta aegis TaxID=1735272 RepID=UPI001B88C1AF|nr:uncharacterized protein LOC121382611 [Gigantopelta aegis]
MYIELKIKQNPLTYGLTDHTTDRTQLLAPLSSPSNMKRIASIRLKFHFLGCMMHMSYLFCAYIIMLIFMTYSIWLGISIVIGSGAGHFVFGALGHQLTKRYTKMATASSPSTADAGVVNPLSAGDPCHM